MSTKRYFDTYFWDDPWVDTLPPIEKLVFLYFLTTPFANIAGIYELTDKAIVKHTKLTPQRVTSIMARFKADKKVYRWGNFLIMRNWPKRQNIGSNTVCIGIERILLELPLELLEFLLEIDYKYPRIAAVVDLKRPPKATPTDPELSTGSAQAYGMDTVPIPCGEGMDTVSHSTLLNSTLPNSTDSKQPEDKFDAGKKSALGDALGSLRRGMVGEP